MRREKEWWEKDVPEKIFSIFAGILYGVWFLVSRTIYGIYRLLRRIVIDVTKNVYARLIVIAGGLIVAWIIAQSAGVFQ